MISRILIEVEYVDVCEGKNWNLLPVDGPRNRKDVREDGCENMVLVKKLHTFPKILKKTDFTSL